MTSVYSPTPNASPGVRGVIKGTGAQTLGAELTLTEPLHGAEAEFTELTAEEIVGRWLELQNDYAPEMVGPFEFAGLPLEFGGPLNADEALYGLKSASAEAGGEVGTIELLALGRFLGTGGEVVDESGDFRGLIFQHTSGDGGSHLPKAAISLRAEEVTLGFTADGDVALQFEESGAQLHVAIDLDHDDAELQSGSRPFRFSRVAGSPFLSLFDASHAGNPWGYSALRSADPLGIFVDGSFPSVASLRLVANTFDVTLDDDLGEGPMVFAVDVGANPEYLAAWGIDDAGFRGRARIHSSGAYETTSATLSATDGSQYDADSFGEFFELDPGTSAGTITAPSGSDVSEIMVTTAACGVRSVPTITGVGVLSGNNKGLPAWPYVSEVGAGFFKIRFRVQTDSLFEIGWQDGGAGAIAWSVKR